MTANKAATASQRKKVERDNWKASGGVFKEIKITKDGAEILAKGRAKNGFEKDWEFINYLLGEYNKSL
jgi:hypothetical protein